MNKIIDAHAHIFPEKIVKGALDILSKQIQMEPDIYASPDGLIDSMNKNGIECSICLPVVVKEEQTISINDYIIELNKKYKNLISLGGIHPDFKDYKKELKRLKDASVKGIKIHPVYQNCDINDERYVNIINEAFKLGLIVVAHAGLDPGFPDSRRSDINHTLNLLDKIGKGKLVLAHMGAYGQWDEVKKKLCGKDVYFDCAMCFGDASKFDGTSYTLMNKDTFEDIFYSHDENKILFGSDIPWGRVKSMLDFVNNTSLSDEQKDKLLYLNAKRLFNID